MAVIASWIGLNQDYFDFYDLVGNFTSSGFDNDTDDTASYLKNGQTFEIYVKDSFYTQFQTEGGLYSTAFMSETDITYDGKSLSSFDGENLSKLAGTINAFGTVSIFEDGTSGFPLYGITGVNVDLSDFMDAILTPSLDDDRSILSQMLNGDDTFNLSDEADLARGLNGSDMMYGYAGNDKLYGGNNNDKLYGGNNNDKLYGGNNNDKLYGGKNNDKLYGGNGNDKSYGQAGNDSLYMDAGNDTLDGGSGTDWLYVTGSKNSVVNLATTTGQNTGYGTDIIKNIENASGGSGVDKFYGTTGNNTLNGNNGNDVLQGKNGNDRLYGGNNNDKLYGGNNNDKLYGGNNNDKLYGGNGNDLLKGDAGRDILKGDAGKDTMFGGSGADTFVFKKTSDSKVGASKADVIKDFQQGVDVIDLSAIDASANLSGNNAFTFDGTQSFGTSKQGDIYYEKFNNDGNANDYTMVYIDTDNDSGTEMSIKLMGLHNLTADDFIL